MSNNAHLYFHSPCFDGAVSAALASEYLESALGIQKIMLHDVNYHLRDQWLTSMLEGFCAVVDFLYHPAAEFWADHHPTTFLTDQAERDFAVRRNPHLVYDPAAPSCASVLWKHFGSSLQALNPNYAELVFWADRIDAARYESVTQAIEFNAPALQISLVLGTSRDDSLSQTLVKLFRSHSLLEISLMPEIRGPFLAGKSIQEKGLQRLKDVMHMTENGIATFDVRTDEVIINRYAPFYFFPEARYSAGILRTGETVKLTAMRNPWIEFDCAPLGQICTAFGGGGHQRVGSILLPRERATYANSILEELLDQIGKWEDHRVTTAAA